MVKNLLKIAQNPPKIGEMSENAKVHLDLCFTYPNGSPHDPESTEISRFSDIFATFSYKKTHRKQSDEKNGFLSIFGPFRGPKVTPKTIKMGEGD